MGRPDLLAATLRAERPTLIYRVRSPKLVVDRVNACVGVTLTIDAREPGADLRALERAKGRIVVLLPAEVSEVVEDAIALLGERVVAVTPAHRISPELERAFVYRLEEEQVL